jgi:tetratricopeptide (TPR) repeat protein
VRGQRLLDEGYAAVRRHEYENGIAKFDAALRTPFLPKRRASYAYGNRAYCHERQKHRDEAVRDYGEAIRRNPSLGWAFAYRGQLYDRGGDKEKALADYSDAIALNPNAAECLYRRGLIFRARHQVEEAIADLREAVRARPNTARYHRSLAEAYHDKRDLPAAIANFDAALALRPRDVTALMGRAEAWRRSGAPARAVADLKKAMELKPYRPERVLNQVAWIEATCPDGAVRNGKDAVEAATRACELSRWENSGVIDTLAAAYAEDGQFPKAIEMQERALASSKLQPEFRAEMEARLAQYRQGQAYREIPK